MNTLLNNAVTHLHTVDDRLALLIDQYGPPTIVPHTNYYQSLVESIISQQLSVKAAATILKRFLALFEGNIFPTAADILTKDTETYRSVGLSRQKATYIQDLALKVTEGTIQFDHLDSLTNDEIIAELTQVKGVGVWTVHMFLMFCMGRLDVLPVGDLGIKNGFKKVYDLSTVPTAEEMYAIANDHQWAPYETIASWYLWRSLENTPILETV
jgi:DNA-3-methyladenine glycosylase II